MLNAHILLWYQKSQLFVIWQSLRPHNPFLKGRKKLRIPYMVRRALIIFGLWNLLLFVISTNFFFSHLACKYTQQKLFVPPGPLLSYPLIIPTNEWFVQHMLFSWQWLLILIYIADLNSIISVLIKQSSIWWFFFH